MNDTFDDLADFAPDEVTNDGDTKAVFRAGSACA